MEHSPPVHDPDFYGAHPYPAYARLRAEDTVHWASHGRLGTGLARSEARVFFEELLARFDRIERAEPVQRARAAMTPAVEHMPLRLAARGS